MRLGLMLAIAAMLVKAALIAAYRLWQPLIVAELVLDWDPLPRMAADWVTETFFWHGIAPKGAAEVFEAVLVLGTGFEAIFAVLCVGLIRRWTGRDTLPRER